MVITLHSYERSFNVLHNRLHSYLSGTLLRILQISKRDVWMLGVVILLLMMATAFMGYVLTLGQMSFWGATVITNLFSAFPVVGDYIVTF